MPKSFALFSCKNIFWDHLKIKKPSYLLLNTSKKIFFIKILISLKHARKYNYGFLFLFSWFYKQNRKTGIKYKHPLTKFFFVCKVSLFVLIKITNTNFVFSSPICFTLMKNLGDKSETAIFLFSCIIYAFLNVGFLSHPFRFDVSFI